jgi:hypothetical protein
LPLLPLACDPSWPLLYSHGFASCLLSFIHVLASSLYSFLACARSLPLFNHFICSPLGHTAFLLETIFWLSLKSPSVNYYFADSPATDNILARSELSSPESEWLARCLCWARRSPRGKVHTQTHT